MTTDRTQRRIGWTFVGVQAVLLVLAFAVPTATSPMLYDIATWHRRLGSAFRVVGVALVAVSAVGLSRRLTAHPNPNGRGTLRVDGLYRFVRHPMYTGVMALAIGSALPNGSALRVGATISLIVLFNAKARFEERALMEHFPDYVAYAETTPRFVPRIVGSSRR